MTRALALDGQHDGPDFAVLRIDDPWPVHDLPVAMDIPEDQVVVGRIEFIDSDWKLPFHCIAHLPVIGSNRNQRMMLSPFGHVCIRCFGLQWPCRQQGASIGAH